MGDGLLRRTAHIFIGHEQTEFQGHSRLLDRSTDWHSDLYRVLRQHADAIVHHAAGMGRRVTFAGHTRWIEKGFAPMSSLVDGGHLGKTLLWIEISTCRG
jgi:hypothetical protein